jgi:hypothetical protein
MIRPSRQTIIAVALFFGLALNVSREVRAQPPQNTAGGLTSVTVEGTFMGALGNRINMKSQDNQEHMVLLSNQTTVLYHGTGDVNLLMRGQLVRFTAPFDQSGVPQSSLAEIEIFTPIQKRGMTRKLVESQTPGIYPVTAEDKPGEKGGKEKSAPAASKSKKPTKKNTPTATSSPPGGQDYLVVGQIRGLLGDQIQVLAGNRPVAISLATEVQVLLTSTDTSLCQPGDSIKVTGVQNSAGSIQAEEIDITGANPLGGTRDNAKKENANGDKLKPSGSAGKREPAPLQDNSKKPATPSSAKKPR